MVHCALPWDEEKPKANTSPSNIHKPYSQNHLNIKEWHLGKKAQVYRFQKGLNPWEQLVWDAGSSWPCLLWGPFSVNLPGIQMVWGGKEQFLSISSFVPFTQTCPCTETADARPITGKKQPSSRLYTQAPLTLGAARATPRHSLNWELKWAAAAPCCTQTHRLFPNSHLNSRISLAKHSSLKTPFSKRPKERFPATIWAATSITFK